MKMKKSFLLMIVVCCAFAACKPLSPSGRGEAEKPLPSRIAFASFEARKMPDQTCQIKLIEFRTTEGKIKEDSLNDFLYPVEVSLMDPAQKRIGRFLIGHPLAEDLEFIDDLGNLGHKTRILDSARFYVRFNCPPSCGFISFDSGTLNLPAIKSVIEIKL
jgi:hypothetical protein